MTDAPEREWMDTEKIYLIGRCSDPRIGHVMFREPAVPRAVEHTPYLRADLVPSWQPIETAPLGERLLAYHEHIDGFAVCVVVADSQGKRTTLLDWDMMVFNATHWMPLPSPPDAD